MSEQRFDALVQQLETQRIDRRTFLVRAVALGASVPAIGAALLRTQPVGAQVATPAAGGPATAAEIGMPGIEHLTTTDKGTIKLYSSWPLTGASEKIGGDSAEAVRLCLEDRGNAAGGFALEYEALDDGIAANNGGWDAGKESENANRVVNDPDAMVYIATYNSGASKISIPILNAAEPPMPMITPQATYPGLTKDTPSNAEGEPEIYYPSGTRNFFRVVPADDIQGPAAANWAFSTLGATKAYVLHDNQLYGAGVATLFRDTFQSLGGEVVGFEPFDPEAPEYQALMTKVADAGPDLVYLGAIVNLNASKLLQDMRALMGPEEVTFLGPDGLVNQDFIEGAGDAAEGAYITFAGVPANTLSTGAGQDYYTRMSERLGEEPDAYATYAYEAAAVVLQAIDVAQAKDRTAILNALAATEGFQGLLGEWSFSDTYDTTATTMSLNVVKDGAITFQEEIAPPAS
ncbi:MAG: hypothetical protein AVDCRST_MAG73-1342 [uncultured Thermomicrobiales bacterium]|uniref:Leucine-binding protein domain-containing protein n=1 Tax=uncultured Thermomicrobiales bacterium TaxID=1645740 RepID=A0A6J4U0U3_9BACT|nr:MAG: hypothetical protein AVDCRST_MAG73-1342 [uncultured Thermomicrobiales bacterium]